MRREYEKCKNPLCPVVTDSRNTLFQKLCREASIPQEYSSLTFERWNDLFIDQPETIRGKQDAVGAALAFAREKDHRFDLDTAARYANLAPPEDAGDPKTSLVLSGANGVGKTSLAVAIAREVLNHNEAILYMRFGEFFDALKERFEKKAVYQYFPSLLTEADVMTQFQRATILIIDEFYADVTEWRAERGEQLINYRYTHQLPTIVTTNMSSAQLIEHWGKTTGHRLQAMAHWIEMGGVELRRRAAMIKSR